MRRTILPAAVLAAALIIPGRVPAQSDEAYEKPPISYSSTRPNDAVTVLESESASGLRWTGGGKWALKRLLEEFHVPVESQVLVFSKTSFQRQAINPGRPRALYFSDNCYIGWVPDGLIEVATIDPQLGPVFYSVDPNATQPRFVRDNNCMTCHGGQFVRGIPSLFVRSMFTGETGEPLFAYGSEVVDFRTSFTNRWGGWYVTGKHGNFLHRGNTLAREEHGQLMVDLQRGANITDLSALLQTKPYLRPDSDIVCLLVLEHQTAMQNTLTRASQDCRRMLAYQKNLQTELKEPVTESVVYDSVKHVFSAAAQQVVDDLLFKDEAELPPRIEGAGAFQAAFCREVPRADDGSSLKDLELAGHLFKNRCSYLIYSQSFRTLPAELKRRVRSRLVHALDPATPDPRYDYIPADEKLRIAKILRQTHPDFKNLSN
jgi:hypothetical protein